MRLIRLYLRQKLDNVFTFVGLYVSGGSYIAVVRKYRFFTNFQKNISLIRLFPADLTDSQIYPSSYQCINCKTLSCPVMKCIKNALPIELHKIIIYKFLADGSWMLSTSNEFVTAILAQSAHHLATNRHIV